MSSDNPFDVSPELYGDRSAADRDASTAEVSPRTLEMLNQTRPWVRLMGVLMWIAVVLMALASAGMLVFAAVGANRGGSGEMFIVAAVYIVMVVIYGFLAKWLTTYASRITALSISESVRDLESALEAQKNFWRLIGIITVVTLILYVVILVLMLAGVALLPMMMNR